MDKSTPIILVVCALVLGAIFGAVFFPTTNTVVQEKTITKEVPVQVLVNQTQIVDKFAELQAKAVSDYKVELSDDDDYLICNSEQYDLDQVTYKKFNDMTVSVDSSDKDDTITTVAFSVDLKFSDKDVESKCYRTDAVQVVYHSDTDEDTEITISN